MSVPTTMFRLTGRDYPPAKLSHASLIIIDAQKEYLSGPLQLSGMDEAVANIARLLDAARKSGRPIIHVRHLALSVAASTHRGLPASSFRGWSRSKAKSSSKNACPTHSRTPNCTKRCRRWATWT